MQKIPMDSSKIKTLKGFVSANTEPNSKEHSQNLTVTNLDPDFVALLPKLMEDIDIKLEKVLKRPMDFWLTHKEAQKFFGVSAQTLRSWRHAGFLSYHRIDRNIMIKFSDIEIFLKNNRHEAFQYKR